MKYQARYINRMIDVDNIKCLNIWRKCAYEAGDRVRHLSRGGGDEGAARRRSDGVIAPDRVRHRQRLTGEIEAKRVHREARRAASTVADGCTRYGKNVWAASQALEANLSDNISAFFGR